MKKLNILIIMFLFSVSLSFAQDTKHYTIKLLEECNDGFSNFGTTFYGENQVIYSSPKKSGSKKKKKGWKKAKHPFLDLYISDAQENGELMNRTKVIMPLDSPHASNVAFTNDLKTVYFSGNIKDIKKKGKNIIAYISIYKADVISPTQWSNVVPVFDNKDYSIGHPTLNADNTKLYFASTVSGNSDIYYVDIHNDGTYGEPVNVRQVNTLSSERFPFFGDDNLLYFSSDKPGGMGDLDIYAVKLDGHSKPVNLGAPFNSKKDDFSFTKKRGGDYGYFSSNRESGKGDDDIYFFKKIEDSPCSQLAKGVVTDKMTGRKIPGALVVLYDKNGNELDSQVVGEDAKFSFNIDCSSSYKVIGSKQGFSEVSKEFISNPNLKLGLDLGLSKIKEVVQPPVIKQPIKPCVKFAEGVVTDKNTGRRIPGALVVLYGHFGRELESQVVGEDARFSFQIDCSSNYKLIASKEHFLEDSKDFVSNTNSELGLDLGLAIEKEVVKTVTPVVQYVAPVTSTPVTSVTPSQYDNCQNALDLINNIYFDLNKSYIRSDAASELSKVVKIMKRCPNIHVEASSHTDCRASNEYNEWLSQRRAQAVVDFIVNYGGIDSSRIIGIGYGESRLRNRCSDGVKCSEAEHQINRRTEFEITNY